MFKWIGKAAGWLFGGGGSNVIEKSVQLASEYIEDPDKRNETVANVIMSRHQLDATQTVPWVDALHKMGRQVMIFMLLWMYWESKKQGIDIDLKEWAMIMTGPGAYMLMKGKGR